MLIFTVSLAGELIAKLLNFFDYLIVCDFLGLENGIIIAIVKQLAMLTQTSAANALDSCFRCCRPLLSETEQACVLTLLFTMYWVIQLIFAVVVLACMQRFLLLFAANHVFFRAYFIIQTFLGPFSKPLLILMGTFSDARNQAVMHLINVFSASIVGFTLDLLLSLLHQANNFTDQTLIVCFGLAQQLSYAIFNVYRVFVVFRGTQTSPIYFRFSYLRIFSANDIWNTIKDFLRYYSAQACEQAFQLLFTYQAYLVYLAGSRMRQAALLMFQSHLLIYDLANARNNMLRGWNAARYLISWQALNYEQILREYVESVRNALVVQFILAACACPVGYVIQDFLLQNVSDADQINDASHYSTLQYTAVFCVAFSAFNCAYYHSIQFLQLFEMFLPIFLVLVLNAGLSALLFVVPMYFLEPPDAIMEFAMLELFKSVEGYALVWLIKKLFIKAIVQLRLRLEDDAYNNIQPLSQAQTVSYLQTQSNFSKNNNAASATASESGATADRIQ